MHKIFCGLLFAVMVLSVDAWGDTQVTATKAAKVSKAKKCLFPKSRKRAPNWVCSAHVNGLAVTAVGSAAKSKAGISFVEQMAAADARAHLVQNLRESVQKKIRGGDDAADKVPADSDNTLMTRITNDSLRDTKIVKSTYGPDGTRYVMVGLDETSAKKLIDSIAADYLEQKHR